MLRLRLRRTIIPQVLPYFKLHPRTRLIPDFLFQINHQFTSPKKLSFKPLITPVGIRLHFWHFCHLPFQPPSGGFVLFGYQTPFISDTSLSLHWLLMECSCMLVDISDLSHHIVKHIFRYDFYILP